MASLTLGDVVLVEISNLRVADWPKTAKPKALRLSMRQVGESIVVCHRLRGTTPVPSLSSAHE